MFFPKRLGWAVAGLWLAMIARLLAGPGTDDSQGAPEHWVVEQMPGGSVTVADGVVTIQDLAGCTVWWKERLTVPLEISYEATVIAAGGPFDRVSDLNCFWLASDPRSPADLFADGHGRTGQFSTYDALQTYYVGQGGNENTTTRFRRYEGGGAKPLLPEHDLRDVASLLEGNRAYRIRIVALEDGVTRYYRDGVQVFEFKDPAPLRSGWFGFRTVKSHLRIRDFKISRPDGSRRKKGGTADVRGSRLETEPTIRRRGWRCRGLPRSRRALCGRPRA